MWPESVDLDINSPCQTLVASGYLKVMNVHVGLTNAHSQMHVLKNFIKLHCKHKFSVKVEPEFIKYKLRSVEITFPRRRVWCRWNG